MQHPSFLAFDIGAESGRALLGTLEEGRLATRELHRFPNGMLRVLGRWHWNIFRLFEEMKQGLKACVEEAKVLPESMALDTWGVDFGLAASDGSLLGLPVTYRDPRTEGAIEGFFEIMPRDEVYGLTGIQFLPFNTLFQLFAMKRDASPLLDAARDLLFMPDLFNYLFTGKMKTEYTFATTSQLLNAKTRKWEERLFEALGIPMSLMQEIVKPGTVLAPLNDTVCRETGIPPIPVVATASHDTGSAVAAVPAEGNEWAYISSGTWSLMGVELEKPVLSPKALELQFTNEGGVGGIRFLKNIMGLWLLQQCRKAWADQGQAFSYEELTRMAEKAAPFKALLDPDRMEFLNPPDMPGAIVECLKKTGEPTPESPAQFARTILESLALKYRFTLDQLRQVSPHPITRIHIIGGGAQNRLLSRFTANATGLAVTAGPFEATAMGNIMVQAMATGHLSSLAQAREVIRNSFPLEQYEPEDSGEWEKAYQRFQEIMKP